MPAADAERQLDLSSAVVSPSQVSTSSKKSTEAEFPAVGTRPLDVDLFVDCVLA